jgi:hypothetical protein
MYLVILGYLGSHASTAPGHVPDDYKSPRNRGRDGRWLVLDVLESPSVAIVQWPKRHRASFLVAMVTEASFIPLGNSDWPVYSRGGQSLQRPLSGQKICHVPGG